MLLILLLEELVVEDLVKRHIEEQYIKELTVEAWIRPCFIINLAHLQHQVFLHAYLYIGRI